MKDRELAKFDMAKPSLNTPRIFDASINYKACPHHQRDDVSFVFVSQCLISNTLVLKYSI